MKRLLIALGALVLLLSLGANWYQARLIASDSHRATEIATDAQASEKVYGFKINPDAFKEAPATLTKSNFGQNDTFTVSAATPSKYVVTMSLDGVSIELNKSYPVRDYKRFVRRLLSYPQFSHTLTPGKHGITRYTFFSPIDATRFDRPVDDRVPLTLGMGGGK